MATDLAGNIIVSGTFLGTCAFGTDTLTSPQGSPGSTFVLKIDKSGSYLWSTQIDIDQSCVKTAVLPDGSITLAATLDKNVDFGGGVVTSVGGSDLVVATLSAEGTLIWNKRFGDENDQIIGDVVADQGGWLFLSGSTEGTIDFGCGPLTNSGDYNIFLAQLGP
jgi:hypothetical protein